MDDVVKLALYNAHNDLQKSILLIQHQSDQLLLLRNAINEIGDLTTRYARVFTSLQTQEIFNVCESTFDSYNRKQQEYAKNYHSLCEQQRFAASSLGLQENLQVSEKK